jgi:glycerol-3-phosphate acyltransferase PlsX
MMIGLMSTHAGIEKAVLMKALKHLDYSEYGGAPLLGVRGVSVISHGKSSPRAIKNAIKVAAKTVESRMSEHIGRRLGETNGNPDSAA